MAGSAGRDILTPAPRQGARDRKLRSIGTSGTTAAGPEDQLFTVHDAGGREPIGHVRHPPVAVRGESHRTIKAILYYYNH